MFKRTIWPVLPMVVFWLTVPASAQEKRSADELEKLSQSALTLASEGRFQDAIDLWEDLLDEVPAETALDLHVNIAVAWQRLGKEPEAWYHLDRYVQGAKSPDKAVVAERTKLAKKLAGDHVRVSFACEPTGALLRFDQGSRAKSYPCPLVWWMVPGKQTVSAEKAGYDQTTRSFMVPKNAQEASQTISLEQKVELGELKVLGQGRAIQVFLDGMLEGIVPFSRKLKPGTYELMVGKPGKPPWKKTITIEPGKTLVEEPPVEEPEALADTGETVPGGVAVAPVENQITKPATLEPRSHVLEWSLIGGGGAMVAAGGLFHLLAYLKDQDLRDEHNPNEAGLSKEEFEQRVGDYQDAWDEEVLPRGVAAYVLYGVGAASAVTGAVLMAVDIGNREKAEKLSRTTFFPLITPEATGMGFELRF
jgi:hypothetical protein